MKKFRIMSILSTLFRLFLIFTLTFIWVRYFIRSLSITIFLTIFITLITDFIIHQILKRKNAYTSLKSKEKKDAEGMFYSLAFKGNPVDFFAELASKKHKILKTQKYIKIENENSVVVLYPYFQLNPLSAEDINIIVKNIKGKFDRIVIPTGEISKEALSLISKLTINITTLDKFETYKNLYKFYDFFPEINVKFKPEKTETFKAMLAYSFNKKRTKSYFFAAIVLLFSSLLVRYSIYYLIMSSVLIIFALVSFYNPFYNNKIQLGVID